MGGVDINCEAEGRVKVAGEVREESVARGAQGAEGGERGVGEAVGVREETGGVVEAVRGGAEGAERCGGVDRETVERF